MHDDQAGTQPGGHADGVGEGALAGGGAVEADDDTVLEGWVARLAWLFGRQGLGRRRFGDGPLAVRGFEEFVTGHGCLGVLILYGGQQ